MVELARVRRTWDKFGQRFARHILHPAELAELPDKPLLFLAGRFAVKEAAVKALGTGFSGGISPRHIETVRLPGGQRAVVFHNAAKKRLEELGARLAHVSITHSRENAAAVVVLED